MANRSLRFKIGVGCLLTAIVLCWCFGNEVFSQDNDPQMTGLPELTQQELEWQNNHMKRVQKVKLNKLGLERINKWRKKKGLEPITEEKAGVVPVGKEIEGIIGEPSALEPSGESPSEESPMEDLPPYVDNSTLKYFPPIRSQGSLPSCGCFSGTYYTMTYMHALAHDLDAKNGGDEYRFSPKWTYNMVNGGEQNGSWYYWAYEIGQKHGAATWAEFPYDSNYRAWCLLTSVWRNAIDRRFDQYGYVASTETDAGIEQVKQMINNGYVLNIPTYVYSWQYKEISDDTSIVEDDVFVGKQCCYWVNGSEGYHAMTVVGYNDHVWVDINSNGTVDAGEKGAFRIANSWGTGWKEAGFIWMAYDALKNPSSVLGGPNSGRIYGWSPSRAHWVNARSNYEPELFAEFTLNHIKRNQLRITLGVSNTTDSVPITKWYPEMIYSQGGPYAFDGSTSALSGTFIFDFTDIAQPIGGNKRYYIGMDDSTLGDIAEMISFKLVDISNGNIESECYDVPKMVDDDQVYAYVDYDFNAQVCSSDADCDDGLSCNGEEICEENVCQPGTPVECSDVIDCTDDICDENTGLCSHTPNDAYCDDGDICTTDSCTYTGCVYTWPACGFADGCCGSDCTYGTDPDCTECGNTVCEVGEDCTTCPGDCISGTIGGDDCNDCFKGDCDGVCHPKKDGLNCPDCAASNCCGDGVCEGEENSYNCSIDCDSAPECNDGKCDPGEDSCNCDLDCGAPSLNEIPNVTCSDAVDNDCDTFTDCDDPDCDLDPVCDCEAKGDSCLANGDCCSGRCHSKKGVCL
jgi:C1A family cysteine protease